MAKYGQPEVEKPKPRNDVYTGLLAISLGAMLIACLLLFLDYRQYEGLTPPKAPLKTTVYRGGELADQDIEGQVVHRVSNRGNAPLVSLHLYGVAADKLTTGINRVYG